MNPTNSINSINHTAVIIIDLQADFTEFKKGILPVAGTGQRYIDEVTEAVRYLKRKGYMIIATQESHPSDHISFYTRHPESSPFDTTVIHGKNQILWPPHCVQGTAGAELLINLALLDALVEKGTHPDYAGYSGFEDSSGHPTELHPFLQEHSIDHLIIFGLTTECGVKATALDAKTRGYRVTVIRSLCRGTTSDTARIAFAELKEHGINTQDTLDIKKVIPASPRKNP